MSSNIDSILDKIINENCDINLRAMKNLQTKISNNLISLEKLPEVTATKFLLSFGKWLAFYLAYKNNNNYDYSFIIKTLSIFKNCIEIFPINAVQNATRQIFLTKLINDIGESNSQFREICDQIIQSLSRKGLNYSQGMPIANNQITSNNNNNFMNISLNYSNSNAEESIQKQNDTNENNTNNNNERQNTFSFKQKATNTPSTFKKIVLNREEEQRIFDNGVNIKHGNSVQQYDSFNLIYSEILNDYPLEYILECEDLLKGFFSILVNCNFLEFGVICYKVLDKLLLLLENKIKENLNGNFCLYELKEKKELILNGNSLNSVENFSLYSLFSLINSIYDINKMSFYIELIKRNVKLVHELMLNTDEWIGILYKILNEFNKVVLFYKNKNYNAEIFFRFLLEYYINMDNEMLLNLIEYDDSDIDVESIQFIKDLFFILPESSLTLKLINKLENLKNANEQINSFVIDYNNANLINKSLEITKKMLAGNTQNQLIIDNFYNILLALKFLNNNSNNDNEYQSVFPNNISPLIKAICDFYLQDFYANLQKSIDLLIKLLSFKNNQKIENNIEIYNAILDEIKVKGNNIFPLFLNEQILNIFLNDLTIEDYQNIILEIIFELFNNDESVYSNTQLKDIFMLIPPFRNNMKLTSLQTKIERTLSYEGIMIKYLRFLFSKVDTIRYTAINFFKSKSEEGNINNNDNLNTSNNLQISNSSFNHEDLNDESNMKKNYSKFKSIDSLLLIQTITNEFMKIIKNNNFNSTNNNDNSIEFMPLLNIIYSTKMDYNMKTSALEQLIVAITNPCYKDYFLNDILNFIIKELTSNENNFTQLSMSNYFISLLKVLDCIIFYYFKDDKINQLLSFKNSKELINLLLPLALQKGSFKHLMSAYSLMFIYYCIFYYNNNEHNNSIDNNEIKNFPVLKFFDKFYYVSLIPVQFIDVTKNIISSSMLNFSINKNIIDFNYYRQHPLERIFNLDVIFSNITNLKSLTLLDIFISITQLLSCYSIYNDIDISNSLVQIAAYYKKLIPNTNELKNLFMDTMNIFDIFFYQNKTIENENYFSNIFLPFLQELFANLFNYVTVNKEFVNDLNDLNLSFIYEMLEFLIRNKKYLPYKKLNLIHNFISNFQNIFIFNQEQNLYKLKLHLIKFQLTYFDQLLPILSEKTFSDSVNTISFFLSKYEPYSYYFNLNYLVWTLSYLLKLINNNKCMEIINSKSFIFVKLLQSPFIEINVLSIKILTLLLNNEIFIKHGTLLTQIFKVAKESNNKLIKVNYYNFLLKSFEYILSKKSIDNENEEFVNEILTVNESIYQEKELIEILLRINENESSYESCIELKYIYFCLNLDIENNDFSNGIFFNHSFYDNVNDILLKEINILQYLNDINVEENPIMYTDRNLNYFFQYTNKDLKTKNTFNGIKESALCVKECLNLIIRSIPLCKQEHYDLFKGNLDDIFNNLIKYSQLIICSWNKYISLNDNEFIQIIQSYTLKYYTYLQFLFDSKLNFDLINNNQTLNNVCYDMMKFEKESEYYFDMKMMFSKILPSIIENTNNINNFMDSNFDTKSNISNKTNKTSIKNDSDTLMQIISTFKKVYEITLDTYGKIPKNIFKIDNSDIKSKNDVMNSISTLVLTSKNCKKQFIKNKFIDIFIDYIEQLNENLLSFNLKNFASLSNIPSMKNLSNKSSHNNLSINNHNNNNTGSNLNFSSNNTNANNNNNSLLSKMNENITYLINEYLNVLILFQNLFYDFNTCEERDSLFFSMKNGKFTASRFLIMLYNIFYDTSRFNNLFENYLKLLVNILSNNKGELCKCFIHSISNSNTLSAKKETLLNLLLDYFTKNIDSLSSNRNFELFVKFLKCILQFKPISQALLKMKFTENIKFEIIKLIQDKKTFNNMKSLNLIEKLMELFISLSFDQEQSKRLGNKDFILALNEVLNRVQHENLIFNILFFFRNVCFVSISKDVFMTESNVLGTIFALLSSNNSYKIIFILSHLIWVLLFNNQTLKTMLCKNEQKTELKNLSIHLQKELDIIKYGDENEKVNNNENPQDQKTLKYLEEANINLKKILFIIEI